MQGGRRDVAYPILVFHQNVVVATDGDQEQDNLDVVKDVDPLLTLRPLSANIEHLVREVAGFENGFADAGRPEACAEDVLVVR